MKDIEQRAAEVRAAVTVRPPKREDYRSILSLRPHPHQAAYIASNAESLEEAEDNGACVPLIITAAGEPVGFAMYARDEDDGNYWIYRLMIDARFQGKGYGRAALGHILEQLSRLPGCPCVVLGVHPENERARRIYESFGFRYTGAVIGGEIVMEYRF
ncbi:Acetyltransferase (GNAT) family [Chelatococcus sambhunathii]|uniref:Spermidine acetyltransferase n=2 Tax=Chelatococcus TaxID=28209 RepID=A0AAC9JT05_9HYPH|nr:MULTISPECIES: GNAT family N-acetyltransferase [Chelatococcus]APF39134.1 spermidine acetyltransferase [Chelatococcus daeguensis]CUA84928.1 Acetyltransferase (GNAT) family [Chelatococcus sambhunathii]